MSHDEDKVFIISIRVAYKDLFLSRSLEELKNACLDGWFLKVVVSN